MASSEGLSRITVRARSAWGLRANLRRIEVKGMHVGAHAGAGVPVIVSGQNDVVPAQRRDVSEQARFGSTRVSTNEQNPDAQRVHLIEAGAIRVFTDVICGKRFERPGLAELMDHDRPGDRLSHPGPDTPLKSLIWWSAVPGSSRAMPPAGKRRDRTLNLSAGVYIIIHTCLKHAIKNQSMKR